MSTPRAEEATPSAQLQSHENSVLDAASTPALSAESIAPSAAFGGALDAMQHAVASTAHVELSAAPPDASEASEEPLKKGKGVGKRLTDRQRVEILELIEKSGGSLSNAEVARRYGITRAAIQKLKRKGAEVRARYRYGSAETRDARKRGGHVMSVPFERELFEWVRGLKARKVPVPPSLVKEKAKLLVPKYGLGSFRASNGWYYNFCRRFNLTTGGLVEERATLSTQEVEADTDQPDTETELAEVQSPQLQQLNPMEAMAQQTYEQQLQQYQQQMAAIAAVNFQQQQQEGEGESVQQQQQDEQQQNSVRGYQSKSDRMLALLEQQNALLERQNSMIEEQAKTIKKLFTVVTEGAASL
ncbi:cAMP-specific 3' [Phytophthora cinnamomi]|uniref:cAMP-specific 3' n=1 Tax=Phytophthora cinnamomi TaxID=4785 RepID=UPI00355A5CD6|nr:cAMP-specific 3' [Phytophthora cinnamomi]